MCYSFSLLSLLYIALFAPFSPFPQTPFYTPFNTPTASSPRSCHQYNVYLCIHFGFLTIILYLSVSFTVILSLSKGLSNGLSHFENLSVTVLVTIMSILYFLYLFTQYSVSLFESATTLKKFGGMQGILY